VYFLKDGSCSTVRSQRRRLTKAFLSPRKRRIEEAVECGEAVILDEVSLRNLLLDFSRGASSDVSKIETGNLPHVEHEEDKFKPQITELALKGQHQIRKEAAEECEGDSASFSY